ncbi:MAG TPA: monovalent cation/H+ antiporter subunit D family protein [Firmicutes bacterium]|nr:monovalent cation/H+ antiporter subunit D family protein [Bacillota bacterium]
MTSAQLLLPLLTLLVAALVLPLLKPRRAAPFALAALGLAFLLWLPLTASVLHSGIVTYHLGGWPPPVGIEITADKLAVFFGGTVFLVALPAAFGAAVDLPAAVPERALPSFWTLYLLLVFSLLGLAEAGDLFNTYVFLEISSLAACALVASVHRPANLEAAFKYLLLSTVGSGCVLMAIALLYMVTGQLNLGFLARELPYQAPLYPKIVAAAGTFLLAGLGVKAALFPLHTWLPDAHASAPAPASALLSGLVVKAYVVVLVRVVWGTLGQVFLTLLPFKTLLLVLATASIFFGSILAMAQVDLKRMLAYSTVAQMGYIFLGLAAGNVTAFTGAILHIFNHALLKGTLFLAAGTIIRRTGERHLPNLIGSGHTCPTALSAFSIAALGMVGIPATCGFTSKWLLTVGALQAGSPLLAWVVLLSSLLNAAYYLPVIILGFFGHGSTGEIRFHWDRVPAGLLLPAGFLACASIVFGLWPSLPLHLAQDIAHQFFL